MTDVSDSAPAQLGFDLGDCRPVQAVEPDRDEILAELTTILQTAKSATDALPWDERTFQYHKVVFPQMAQWLADDARNQLCFEFAQEVERLELLLAA
jgi:hypothetical protein